MIKGLDKFFEEKKSREVRLRKPFAIIFALAVTISLYQYYFIARISTIFPEELQPFFKIGGVIGSIGSFLGIFAVWLIVAALMHGLSFFFGGKGSFRRTFEFVGYGFFPSLVGTLITAPLSILYLSTVELPQINFYENIDEALLNLFPPRLVYISLAVNLAVTAWSLAVWSYALKHARNLSLRKSFTCALIPTLLFGSYMIRELINVL